jgi:hypothetical protein
VTHVQDLGQAGRHGERAARSPQLGWLARAGLVARGAVYVIIGVLAVELALGEGGKATNQQGALHTIAKQPFGKVLVILMAIGLAGYAIWRLLRAAIGHGAEGDRDDAKDRISGLVSGIVYAALCVTAIGIVAGSGGGSSGHPDNAAGGVLGWPAGPWLVGLAGVILIGVGLDQGRKGYKREFLEDSRTGHMSHGVRKAFTGLGVFGHLSRMVVFALIGWFLIRAAVDYDPHKAVGLDGALAKLGDSSFGPVLLGLVALGLLGFGVYSVADARYRRV